jgi:hypothetical protein
LTLSSLSLSLNLSLFSLFTSICRFLWSSSEAWKGVCEGRKGSKIRQLYNLQWLNDRVKTTEQTQQTTDKNT